MIFENASLFFKKLKKFLRCPCFPFPDLITAEFPRCRIRVFWKSSRRGPLFPRGNMCRRHAGKAVARMKSGGIRVRQQYARRQGSSAQAKRRHAGKAAAHRRSGGHRQNEGRSAAESRKKFRRLGLPVCTAVGFCPAVFCTREPFPGRPVWTLWERRAAWIRAFRLRRPACLPDGSLWDFLPLRLQFSARIFSSSSCR